MEHQLTADDDDDNGQTMRTAGGRDTGREKLNHCGGAAAEINQMANGPLFAVTDRECHVGRKMNNIHFFLASAIRNCFAYTEREFTCCAASCMHQTRTLMNGPAAHKYAKRDTDWLSNVGLAICPTNLSIKVEVLRAMFGGMHKCKNARCCFYCTLKSW